MAEHPGAMEPGEFDLVGFAVGVAERDQLITGEHVAPGDVLIGLPSPGLRSQRLLAGPPGAARARPAARSTTRPSTGAHHTLADELLEPSVIYAAGDRSRSSARSTCARVAHITGGGMPGNLVRVLPPSVDAVVDRRPWEAPRIFGEIQRLGEHRRRRDGQGVQPRHRHGRGRARRRGATGPSTCCAPAATRAVEIGRIEKGDHQVRLVGRRTAAD